MLRPPASTDRNARTRPSRARTTALVALGALAALTSGGVYAPRGDAPVRPMVFGAATAHAAEISRGASTREQKPTRATGKARAPRDTPYGRAGDPRKVTRTVKIEMSDTMRYFPDHVTVKKGQTVRFNVRNKGDLPHEMVLGTMEDLKKHAEIARRNPDMIHDDANIARADPGETGRIVWHFTRAGEFYYGCLVPGHFDAGMIGTIVVR